MQKIKAIGEVPWSKEDIKVKLEEFAELYNKRPIKNDKYGMKSPHMFSTWFILQYLKPKVIIESGVWLGGGTWFFEKACPDAKLYCIDINLDPIRYKSKNAEYIDRDFSTVDWDHLPKKETILFFDDHQNAYERVKTAKWFDFEQLIFEDNYPASQGGCYSLKKAFMGAGYGMKLKTLKQKVKRFLEEKLHVNTTIPSNYVDAEYLKRNLEIYYEFPPIFKSQYTRWGDPWNEENYPTPKPLLQSIKKKYQQIYHDEAVFYTWICYVKLKGD